MEEGEGMTKMEKLDLDELRRELSAYLEENYTGCGDEQADELIANNKLSYFAYGGGFLACRFDILNGILEGRKKTFSESLLDLLAEKEMKPVEFYKKAGISKEHFSKIKNNVDYQPSKSATMAMVLALKLPLDEAEELMAKAGYTFSTALIQDLVVKFFIQEEIFDVDAVNVELYKLGKKPLTNQRLSGEPQYKNLKCKVCC